MPVLVKCVVNGSQDLKNGLGNILPAARSRADAMYFDFIVLCNGLRFGHPRGFPGRSPSVIN